MQTNSQVDSVQVDSFPVLKVDVVHSNHVDISARDHKAIFDILTWVEKPFFFKPGRTAWYELQDPILTDRGELLTAAKIKGVGGLNPEKQTGASGIRGENPVGLLQPSNTEYAAGVRRAHFGVAEDGEFCIAYSEPAPFGAITRKRAEYEYKNALHLNKHDVPAIVPFCLVDYPDLGQFRGETLSAVVSLTPARAPTRMEYFVLDGSHLDDDELRDVEAVRQFFTDPSAMPQGEDEVRVNIAHAIGALMQNFSAAGMFRHSCYWDNFMFDPRNKRLFLTDLDSTMFLKDIPTETRGLQQARDLAGALFRLADCLYRDFVVRARSFESLRKNDPFAAILAGYFQVPEHEAKELTSALWRYFGAHWFVIDKMADQMAAMPFDMRKSYQVDTSFFYCLAICSFSDLYRKKHKALGLEPIPEAADLDARMQRFLGEKWQLLRLMMD